MNPDFPLTPQNFYWATGIEDTFIAHVHPGYRLLDEYEHTQHYRFWKSDLDLAAGTGIKLLRWGIPWYRVQPAPEVFDWSWTDEVLDYMVNVKGIRPVLDLIHYGTPLWMDNSFINAHYPRLVAAYAAAVAERYRSLSPAFTPFNEPAICAKMCGYRGVWPPYLTGDDGYYKLQAAIARGVVLTTRALKDAAPSAPIVHVEALWHHWTSDPSPAVRRLVQLNNLKQYLCTDLCLGRVDGDHPLYETLIQNGFEERDFRWFHENRVEFDVFGANYYPWSYGEVRPKPDGTFTRSRKQAPGFTIGRVLQDSWERYRLPVMVTETSAKGAHARRSRWMDETIEEVKRLRCAGVPVIGYTWFPLFSMFDWEYRTGRRPLRAYSIDLGLFECSFDEQGVYCRQETPLVERYRRYTAQPAPPFAEAR